MAWLAMIKTERLNICPATRIEMETLIQREMEESLKAAYIQMLEGALQNPEKWEWYIAWLIKLKNGEFIGDISFKGLEENGTVEIGYGILKKYWNNGYATEAVAAMTRWAYFQDGVVRIEAETEPTNMSSQRVLEKCGFVPSGIIGNEGPRFIWQMRTEP